jgi:hypothetical protein
LWSKCVAQCILYVCMFTFNCCVFFCVKLNRLYAQLTSAFCETGVTTSGSGPLYRATLDMALFYSRCLQELPKMSISDVHRICRLTSKTPATKMDKGFKLYASSYIFDYEGLYLLAIAHVSIPEREECCMSQW